MTTGFMRNGDWCQVCDSPHRALLLKVPYLGPILSLCTACVLHVNAGSFCAVCLDVYDYDDTPPPANPPTICGRCPASAHITCLPPAPAFTTYICQQCLDPSFSFISLHADEAVTRDLGKLKQLFCAAKISAVLLQRAAAVAGEDEYQKSIAALEAIGNATNAIDRVSFFRSYLQNPEEIDMDENDMHDGNSREATDRAFSTSNQQNQNETHLDDDGNAKEESDEASLTSNQQNQDETRVDDDTSG